VSAANLKYKIGDDVAVSTKKGVC